MKIRPISIATCLAMTIAANAAITVNSSSFNAVTNSAIDLTGLADWGYISNDGGLFNTSYNDVAYGSLTDGAVTTISTVSGTSTIGTVTLTEGTTGTDTVGAQTNDSPLTFGGAASFGSYGGYAPGEQDVWTMDFNDLGVGQFVITLYLGHSSTNRSFDMDVSGSGITPFTTTTGGTIADLGSTVAAYGSSGSSFTYTIDVTTTAANDSLTLTHGDTGGGSFGGAMFAGYTVSAAIPEPSTAALVGLAGLVCFARRRR